MRIVFSRKGFDSTYGGVPSPIIDNRPVFLPIPGSHGETCTYESLGIGGIVSHRTRGRIRPGDVCHDDPMFADGYCWLGQAGAAQGHLARQGVTTGDVFLFFGLFAEPHTGERHHRIFGAMRVSAFGSPQTISSTPGWRAPPRPHPHFQGAWEKNNCIYHGAGTLTRTARPALRLTRAGGPLNRWIVPEWLGGFGLSYHRKPERWIGKTELESVKRGQEFVCDIENAKEPRAWLDGILREIES